MQKTMLEPDTAQPPPAWPENIKKMWRELGITHLPLIDEAVVELLQHLRTMNVNGGAEFACFELSHHPVLHFYDSRNTLDRIDFFAKFLAAPAVKSALPMLPISELTPYTLKPDWGSSFTLDGEIASVLNNGGAYERFRGSEAKQLGQGFCQALFDDRYTEVQVYRTGLAWSSWFREVAWDQTWFGIDKRLSRFWLLALTDTD